MPKKDLKKFLEEIDVPSTFGVYKFFNDVREPIYVGKSVNLRRRLQQYLLASSKKKFRKSRSIINEATHFDFETCSDEKEALLLENELIKNLKPKFNTAGAFSFLYPVIAAKYSNRRLVLIRTTTPQEFSDFQLFGAFRDRNLVKEMFERLEYLLSMVGHKEPCSRMKDIPKVIYTRRIAFREVPEEYWPLLRSFFSGSDSEFLGTLCTNLLSHSTAVANAAEVESSLKVLRYFFNQEARKLYINCKESGRNDVYVKQEQRDSLFIQVSVRTGGGRQN